MQSAHLVVCHCVTRLKKHFENIRFEHVPRLSNFMADALAVLGSKISDYASPDRQLTWFSCLDARVSSVLSCAPETAFALEEYSAWYDLIDFLSHGRLPEDCIKAGEVRLLATRHVLKDGILFRLGQMVFFDASQKMKVWKQRGKFTKALVDNIRVESITPASWLLLTFHLTVSSLVNYAELANSIRHLKDLPLKPLRFVAAYGILH